MDAAMGMAVGMSMAMGAGMGAGMEEGMDAGLETGVLSAADRLRGDDERGGAGRSRPGAWISTNNNELF